MRFVNIKCFLFGIILLLSFTAAGQSNHSDVNVAILGDSNTWLGGDDCSKDKAWSKWFNDAYGPATCRSYARSGATWTNTSYTVTNTTENIGVLGDNNVIYNQVQRLIAAYDSGDQPLPQIIFIAAGANDAWFVIKRPAAFALTSIQALHNRWRGLINKRPSQVLTLAESVAYNCLLLRKRFPQALIVLVTPSQTTQVKTTLIRQTGDIIEAAGQSVGATTVRLDILSRLNSNQERQRRIYTYDGTHTSAKGAEHHAQIIMRHLEGVYKR